MPTFFRSLFVVTILSIAFKDSSLAQTYDVTPSYLNFAAADIAVWRPSTGTWYVLPSSGVCPAIVPYAGMASNWPYCTQQWGLSNDVPIGPGFSYPFSSQGQTIPYEYLTVYRPNTGEWFVLSRWGCDTGFLHQFNWNGFYGCVAQWGASGYVPKPGYFSPTYDRPMQPTVFNPASAGWLSYTVGACPLHMSYAGFASPYFNNVSACIQNWGSANDVTLTGNAIDHSPSVLISYANGSWSILSSTTSCPSGTYRAGTHPSGAAICSLSLGVSGDIPLTRDFDGDGRSDFGIWRPSTGTWFMVASSGVCPQITAIVDTRNGLPVCSQQWGLNGDEPIPANYSGTAAADLAVFRPSTAEWFIMPATGVCPPPTTDNGFYNGKKICYRQWGLAGDIPVPGARYDANRWVE